MIDTKFRSDSGVPSEPGIAYTSGLGRQPIPKCISKVTGY